MIIQGINCQKYSNPLFLISMQASKSRILPSFRIERVYQRRSILLDSTLSSSFIFLQDQSVTRNNSQMLLGPKSLGRDSLQYSIRVSRDTPRLQQLRSSFFLYSGEVIILMTFLRMYPAKFLRQSLERPSLRRFLGVCVGLVYFGWGFWSYFGL